MILGVIATLTATASDPLEAGSAEFDDVGIDLRELPIHIAPLGTDNRGIVNGTNAGPNDYPESVALFDGWQGYQFCSGTLIHPQWVLTAGHCLEGQNINRIEVRFGTNAYSPSASYDAVEGIIHPNYVNTNYNISNDVALLRLASSVQGVAPAVLNDEIVNSGWQGTVMSFVGFGTTNDNGSGSGLKRYTDIEVDSYDSQVIYSYDRNNSDGHQNVCYGDSGGSAFENEPSGRELSGVNSFVFAVQAGQEPCNDGGNGVARVDQHINWISGYVPDLRLSPDDPPQTGGTTEPEPIDTGIDLDEISPDYDEWSAPVRPVKGVYAPCSTGPTPAGPGGVLLVGMLLLAYRPRPR